MEELIRLLKQFAPMSEKLEEHLRSILRPLHFKKWDYLLEVGGVANHILYLEKGLVRSYSVIVKTKRSKKTNKVRNKKVEVSNWFMKEGNIIISVKSFLQRIPAYDWIQALEDCVCWGITHAELEATYLEYPEFERIGRLITGLYYCVSEDRHLSQRMQDPVDKYRYILETEPALLERVQQIYMSSYLGVSLRTFQMMRKKFRDGSAADKR
jgi:CRP-like cAMP-binding protein